VHTIKIIQLHSNVHKQKIRKIGKNHVENLSHFPFAFPPFKFNVSRAFFVSAMMMSGNFKIKKGILLKSFSFSSFSALAQ
jgi:hypothetical protein